MNVKRCKHGMIENQCGICKKWEDHSWTVKKEDFENNSYSMSDKEEKKA